MIAFYPIPAVKFTGHDFSVKRVLNPFNNWPPLSFAPAIGGSKLAKQTSWREISLTNFDCFVVWHDFRTQRIKIANRPNTKIRKQKSLVLFNILKNKFLTKSQLSLLILIYL